jgi:hypothetical protein
LTRFVELLAITLNEKTNSLNIQDQSLEIISKLLELGAEGAEPRFKSSVSHASLVKYIVYRACMPIINAEFAVATELGRCPAT